MVRLYVFVHKENKTWKELGLNLRVNGGYDERMREKECVMGRGAVREQACFLRYYKRMRLMEGMSVKENERKGILGVTN